MKKKFSMETNRFTLPVRVYYEDTDAGGVVYHSNYINFMERARTEWLRELGFAQDVLARELGVIFLVRSLQVDYLRAARFNDLLLVQTSIEKMERTSLYFQHDIYRQNIENDDAHEHLISAAVRVVCVDACRFRPSAIPLSIKGKLSSDH